MAKEIKYIVRIAGVDLDGKKPIGHQLTKVKGVSVAFANMTLSLIAMDKYAITGELEDSDIKRIEDVLNDPIKFGAPAWMLNRRNDPETGQEMHLISNDVNFVQGNDIKMMRKVKTYKGMRHSAGLPVRGQRTKSNFRNNKGKVQGVRKKSK